MTKTKRADSVTVLFPAPGETRALLLDHSGSNENRCADDEH